MFMEASLMPTAPTDVKLRPVRAVLLAMAEDVIPRDRLFVAE